MTQAANQGPNPVPQKVYVIFAAEVVRHTAENLLNTLTRFANARVPEVTLMLNTPGGDTSLGIGIYNVLRGLPFDLTTHNIGTVASIGNAVFLAGKQRYAAPQATFMFHGVSLNASGRLDEKYLREQMGAIDAEHQRIGAVIADRTRLTRDEIDGLFREAQTKDAQYALNVGIIDDVREVVIPPGASSVTIVNAR